MPPVSRGLRNILSRSLSYCNSKPALSSLSTRNLIISDEVSQALRNDCPVVSLESTIITHGMPHPTNKEMAVEVEDIIRQCGATPATVAVIEGNIHVGLEPGQLDQLAELKSPAVKTSRRDLAFVTSQGLSGGTTVSGTMLVSHMAGIDVFVTGGVGGVHRGGESSMDVSADLTELGRTPVCVVSAGVKSILDIGLTLEYLETQGVCVAAFSKSKSFPAFYTPSGGYKAPYNVTNYEEAAGLVLSGKQLGLSSGILIGVPIPESQAAQGEMIEEAIKIAVEEARVKNITGRDVTPYILARLNDLTGGESLKANLALVKNNARVGAGIAVELAAMKSSSSTVIGGQVEEEDSVGDPVAVVGGSIYDFVVRLSEGEISLQGGTHRGSLRSSHGGVGRNVASALAMLGTRTRFVSAVGRDMEGEDIVRAAGLSGLNTDLVLVETEARTATYTAFLDSSGDCKFGVGDMTVHGLICPQYLRAQEAELAASSLIVCDGNLEQSSVHTLLEISHTHGIPFFYEPADLSKAAKPLSSPRHSAITYCSPNFNELNSMLSTLPDSLKLSPVTLENCEQTVVEVAEATKQLISHYGLQVVLVTLSDCGVVLVRKGRPTHPLPTRGSLSVGPGVSAVWYPCTDPCPQVVSVSGAGDCLTAGFLAGVLRGLDQATAVSVGLQAAKLSCQVSPAVPESLNSRDINWETPAEGIVLFEQI